MTDVLLKTGDRSVRVAPKLCCDCKHYLMEGGLNRVDSHWCMRGAVEIDPVTGNKRPLDLNAYRERGGLLENNCGPHARFFEQKEVVDV